MFIWKINELYLRKNFSGRFWLFRTDFYFVNEFEEMYMFNLIIEVNTKKNLREWLRSYYLLSQIRCCYVRVDLEVVEDLLHQQTEAVEGASPFRLVQ